jgi:hypothetical protein
LAIPSLRGGEHRRGFGSDAENRLRPCAPGHRSQRPVCLAEPRRPRHRVHLCYGLRPRVVGLLRPADPKEAIPDRCANRKLRICRAPPPAIAGRWSSPGGLVETGLRGCRNVVAKYPFERSHGFPGIQPNSGHGDSSRLSSGVRDTQLGPNARTSAGNAAVSHRRERSWPVVVAHVALGGPGDRRLRRSKLIGCR